jgi:hypothetical protein
MPTQSRLCADCGEMFPSQRGETVCRVCTFGPHAPRIAGMRGALRDAALVLGPCQECAQQGMGVCAVCTVWAVEYPGAFGEHAAVVPVEELPV